MESLMESTSVPADDAPMAAALAPEQDVPPDNPIAAPASRLDPLGHARWTAWQRSGMVAQAAVAVLLIGVAILSSIQGLDDENLRVHHLEHAALLCGGGLLGLLAGLRVPPPGWRFAWEQRPWFRSAALAVLVCEPLLLMAAMIPSTSPWIEARPPVHAAEHLVVIGMGVVLAVVGRLFSAALGWLLVLATAGTMAVFGGMILARPVSAAVIHLAPALLSAA